LLAKGCCKVASPGARWPSTINLDGYVASHRAIRLLGKEDARWQSVKVRNCRYLNNIVEQDHRAIKRRCASMLGFKSFKTAEITLAGIELAHRIRKQQFCLRRGRRDMKQLWDRALAGAVAPNEASKSIPEPPRELAANAPELNRVGRRRVRRPRLQPLR